MDTLRRSLSRWKRYHIKVHLADEDLMMPLTVRPRDTVMDLRALLVREGITSWKKTFYYNSRQLEEHETLKEANIQNGSVLLLVSSKSKYFLHYLRLAQYCCDGEELRAASCQLTAKHKECWTGMARGCSCPKCVRITAESTERLETPRRASAWEINHGEHYGPVRMKAEIMDLGLTGPQDSFDSVW